MTVKQEELIEALNRIDELASISAEDNDNGEAEQLNKDYNLIFDFINNIESLLWIPCCHTTGMHDPQHFEQSKYICNSQKAEALERFCKELGINPETKSREDCGWCAEYPDKKKGEGLKLFTKKNK